MTANWVEKEFETRATLSIIHGMLGFARNSNEVIESIQNWDQESKS